jgi:NADH:ubiquinone reductase (H+-translocating)
MTRVLILGAGFAGLWAAASAARARHLAARSPDEIEILVLDRRSYHSIRVRNYEVELADTLIPLNSVLDPIDVCHAQGDITTIDAPGRTVGYVSDGARHTVSYDRLICALGSELFRPPIPGLADHSFDVDTFHAADKLGRHIAALPKRIADDGQYTALVVGAGLTGIEVAAEMPARLRAVINHAGEVAGAKPRVILADRGTSIASAMGGAQPVIQQALEALGVETLAGVSVTRVDEAGVTLTTGQRIPAATVIWCAGMKAAPLAAQVSENLDRFGRLPVDDFLRVNGAPSVFAAGDVANLMVDEGHDSVMSCQHSRPMGRYAGHNAVCDLLGQPMLSLQIPWYTTILDLGAWGAVYTEGWDRHLVAKGADAKRTKEIINRQRIYPPVSGDRQAIFDAAAPVVQAPPQRFN